MLPLLDCRFQFLVRELDPAPHVVVEKRRKVFLDKTFSYRFLNGNLEESSDGGRKAVCGQQGI